MDTTKIFDLYNKDKDRFKNLILKYIGRLNANDIIGVLDKIDNKKDYNFWGYLFIINRPIEKISTAYEKIRGQKKAKIIKNLLPEKFQVDQYLDIGIGTGYVAYKIGESLFARSIFGLDIYDTLDPFLKNKIKFSVYNGYKIPFRKKFDLITAIMVLHHVKKLRSLLNSIKSVLKPGGLFIINEHDAINSNTIELIKFQHVLISKLFKTIVDNPSSIDYYERYRSKTRLNKIFVNSGFQLVSPKITEKIFNNPTNYYYQIWKLSN